MSHTITLTTQQLNDLHYWLEFTRDGYETEEANYQEVDGLLALLPARVRNCPYDTMNEEQYRAHLEQTATIASGGYGYEYDR